MNQYAFTAAQAGKTLQTIMGGEECDRQPSRILRIHALGQGRKERRRYNRFGRQARGCESKNSIPDFKFGNARTNLSDNPRTFRSERNISARVHTQRHQHIAKIDPRGQHTEPNFIWLQRCRSAGPQLETVERPRPHYFDAKRPTILFLAQLLAGVAVTVQPRNPSLRAPDGDA
jgi:hypothetical protein